MRGLILQLGMCAAAVLAAQSARAQMPVDQDELIRRSVNSVPRTDGDAAGRQAETHTRGRSLSDVMRQPLTPWNDQVEIEAGLGNADWQEDVPDGVDPEDEALPTVEADDNRRTEPFVPFAAMNALNDLLSSDAYRSSFNAAIKGPVALWSIAMMQTEPSLGAGGANAINAGLGAVANVTAFAAACAS